MEGYRNNAYGCGGGDGSIKEIIFFEMEELGNTDIPKYLNRNYGLTKMTVAACLRSVQNIALGRFGKGELFGLWLTTREGALRNYCDKGENTISKYVLPKGSFPISDLGEDGTLFVVPCHPDFLTTEEETVIL